MEVNINPNTEILFILGEMASGKSTLAHTLADRETIEVSSIVNKLMNAPANQRIHNKALDLEIIRELQSLVYSKCKYTRTPVTILSIRQKTIYDALRRFAHNNGFSTQTLWLDISAEERKRRFLQRADERDTLSFEEYEERDAKLGLLELKESIFEKQDSDETIIIFT